jgi:hypothetical protein
LGQGQAPAPDEFPLEVLRQVRRLDSRELAVREAAEKTLIEMGSRVLDHLPEVTERTSAEVAQRIARIRQTLQKAVAGEATRASRVTLHGDAMRLSEILAAVEKQTGNPIVDYRKRFRAEIEDPTLEADFDDASFWPAMDQILDRAGLSVYPYGEEKALNVVTRPDGQLPRQGPACYSGPFRFQVVRVEARRELRQRDQRALFAWLEINWEPRLRPVSLQLRMEDLEAVDDRGDPVEVDTEQAVLEVSPEPNAMATEFQIPFTPPPRSVEKIARLKGTLGALMQGKVETFRFEDFAQAKNVEKRIAGVTVTLVQVRKNHDVWEIRMRVRFDEAGGALQSHRNWIFGNEAALEDAEGNLIPYHAYDTTGQSENEVGIAYLFGLEGPLDKYTFVYKTTGLIVSTQFDFEILDVDLP